ncbi:MAG: 30S ribosomal protein S3ae [Thermoplasmatales archaeon]|nr:MAG: 30S ribosomal protein S3ae [Thermoplasmatales archaeon]
MAKARSRATVRKIKDKWKAKKWYDVLAPPLFDSVTIADTLSGNPDDLINRVTAVSLQDLTNDFRKSHIKLYFKIHKVEETKAFTKFAGHTLTSDYLRRMIRRRRSKIDGVYDATTKDGATIRVKPFATTDKRVQNSQRKIVREAMKKTIVDQAKIITLSEFVKNIIDGKIGGDIYKNCKKLYPVKRVEIYKTEVIEQPTVMIEDKKPSKKKDKEDKKTEETKEEDKELKEEKLEKTDKKTEKKAGEKIPVKKSEPKKTSTKKVVNKSKKTVKKSAKK